MLNTGSDLEVSFTDFVQYLKNGEISEMYVEKKCNNYEKQNVKAYVFKKLRQATRLLPSLNSAL